MTVSNFHAEGKVFVDSFAYIPSAGHAAREVSNISSLDIYNRNVTMARRTMNRRIALLETANR